jgi:hypothetical protein
VVEAHDDLAGVPDEPGGGVPQPVAQRLGPTGGLQRKTND